MKLKIDAFEELARKEGFNNGCEFWQHLEGGIDAYELAKGGAKIGYEIVKNLYNEVGAKGTLVAIDFGKGTLNSFKAKYIEVAGVLY